MATITKYYSWRENQENGVAVINWDAAGDTVKVMLTTSAYTPAQTHVYISEANANEVTGTNYTATGGEIASKTVVQATGTTTVDGADVTWLQDGSGFANARYAVIYKDTGTPATSPMVGYIDLGADKGNVNGDLTIQWNSSGIYTVA